MHWPIAFNDFFKGFSLKINRGLLDRLRGSLPLTKIPPVRRVNANAIAETIQRALASAGLQKRADAGEAATRNWRTAHV
ncbi:MAG TPA: hypothetical protein VIV34_02540, partial [Pseudolabrys sp.]